MELTVIIALLLMTAFLSVLLRQYQPEFALGVGVVAGVLVLLAVLKNLLPTLSALRAMLENAALPSAYVGILFKALGICLLTQLAADTCRDAGENALAAKAEFVGKIMLLMISLPLFQKITALSLSLMQGAL